MEVEGSGNSQEVTAPEVSRASESNEGVESWLAALASAPPVPVALAVGDRLAEHFVIERQLGVGGMGVVFLAHHLVLERRVAIKLHRADSERAASALLREARAIASVEHDNVVVVHEVGTWDHYVFVAMEYIDGWTARAWVEEHRPTWREIVALYVKAGRGLQAAHARGLTHRDFKPDNVLVGRDGRVRVADFGLARPARDVDDSSGNGRATPPTHGAIATDGLMGSPAYMAPEQYRTHEVDARADQFGFCVSLHEALAGDRPFVADSLPALADAILQGRTKPLDPSFAPAHVRAALARGLQVDPADRFPDMAALLAAIAHDPAESRRRRLRVGGGLVIAVAATWWVMRAPDPTAACLESPEPAAWWSTATRDHVQQAFAATAHPAALESFAGVDRALSQRVVDAQAVLHDACEATHVAGTSSKTQLEDQKACLQQSEREQTALVELLLAQTSDTIERSVAAAEALPSALRCTAGFRADDVAEADRAAADEILRRIARVDEARDAGLYAQAITDGEAMQAEVAAFGYPAIEARLLLAVGIAHGRRRRPELAMVPLREALRRAVAADDERLAAEITIQLMFNDGYLASDAGTGDGWTTLAEGWLDRIGRPADLELRFLQQRSLVRRVAQRFADALADAEAALALHETQMPNNILSRAALLSVVGESHRVMDHPERAIPLLERSAADYLAVLGPAHPSYGNALNVLGSARLTRGDLEGAEKDFRAALDVGTKGVGPGRPLIEVRGNLAGVLGNTGRITEGLAILEDAWRDAQGGAIPDELLAGLASNLARMHEAAGNLDRAAELASEALELSRRTMGEDSVPFASALLMRASLPGDDDNEALAQAERGLQIFRAKLDEHTTTVANGRLTRGEVLSRLDRCADALPDLTAAQTDIAAALGAEHPLLARVWLAIGKCLVRTGRPREAIEALERCKTLLPAGEVAPQLDALRVRALLDAGEDARARGVHGEALARSRERGDEATIRQLETIVPEIPVP